MAKKLKEEIACRIQILEAIYSIRAQIITPTNFSAARLKWLTVSTNTPSEPGHLTLSRLDSFLIFRVGIVLFHFPR